MTKIIRISKSHGKVFLLFCLTFFWVSTNIKVYSQNRDNQQEIIVKGTVVDNETNEPLIGVSVRVKGSSQGTVTDLDGNYSVAVRKPSDAVFVFSYLGYTELNIPYDGKNVIAVKLNPLNNSLNEVVVVGYGTQKKSDITGSVGSVSKDRIDNSITSDIIQLMQGSVAGFNVIASAAGADPESGAVMLVRGRNSISAQNDPLIVLDGVPYNGSLSDISANDVQSIEVLKDASAAAIYGSRAANGVILIETKKGQKGKVTVKYDGYYSIQKVANFPDMMNGDQYYEYKKGWVEDDDNEADAKLTEAEKAVYESGSYKNWTWKDLLIRTGHSQRHNLSISGGGEATTFNVSASYLQTKGIVINDQYKRASTRINLTTRMGKWLTVGSNTSLAYTDKGGATPPFVDVFNKTPLAVPFNPDGSVNIYPVSDDHKKINPLECLLYDDYKVSYSVSTTNYVLINFPWINGLTYKLNTGFQYGTDEKNWYRGTNTNKSGAFKGEAQTYNGMKRSLLVENIISYKREIGKHNIFLTGLYSWEDKLNKGTTIDASGFVDDNNSYYAIHSATTVKVNPIKYEDSDMVSWMFRGNYTFDNRYIMTFTVRRDGASVFGSDTKKGTFPSLALGWNLHNEKFYGNIKNVMNNFKLRASYGKNGNNAIKPYQTIAQMENLDYTDGSTTLPGYIVSSLGNPLLGWETTKALNFGFDYGFLQSRISGEFNIYRNKTTSLLLERRISPVHGVDKITQNIGKTRNEGIEFSINSTNIRTKDFSWQSLFSMSFLKTKIVDLYGDGLDDIDNKWFIGKSIKANYDYKIIGVWQLGEEEEATIYGAKPGYAKYEDVNRDINDKSTWGIDPGDRQVLGSSEPDFIWNFSNTFKYKDFSLFVLMYGSEGVKKANPYKDRSYLINREFWTPNNPINSYWGYDKNANKYLDNKSISPSSYENADFIRIKDITLTYNLPRKVISKLGLSKAAVYFSGKNLITITDWEGLDPELDNQRAIPLQREYTFGLNFSF